MIVDLCSGLGRFKGDDDVISIDIQRKVNPTIIADIKYLPLRKGLKPKLCHASPPCTYFSIARNAKGRNCKGIAEGLRLVAVCFDAFQYLEPKMWTLENPWGMLRRILPDDANCTYKAHDFEFKKTSFWSNNRALKRALIPQDVRQKILEVVK